MFGGDREEEIRHNWWGSQKINTKKIHGQKEFDYCRDVFISVLFWSGEKKGKLT